MEPDETRDRPLLLGELVDEIVSLVKPLRTRGSPLVHRAVVAIALRELLLSRGPFPPETVVDLSAIARGLHADLASLGQALSRLRARPRSSPLSQVAVLRLFGGLGEHEIAVVLSLPPEVVERQWRFSRAFLRRELERSDKSQEDEG